MKRGFSEVLWLPPEVPACFRKTKDFRKRLAYVFGLPPKNCPPIKCHRQTEIYAVLVAGGFLPTAPATKHKKNKSEVWGI